MRNYLILIALLVFISSCVKSKTTTVNLEEQLIGRWEVIESSQLTKEGERITYTYGPDGDREVEYTIGIDYSSGFELMKENKLDLIWYGENKGQFFSWKLTDQHLIIDEGSLDFTIVNVNESTLDLEFSDGNYTYKMIRLK